MLLDVVSADAIALPASAGTPTARLQALCDAGSLQWLGHSRSPARPRVGVVAAAGSVSGRTVVCYAQDSRVAGGSVGVAEAEIVVEALRTARRWQVPLVAFLESAGARLQEGPAALGGFGRIFFENVATSGRVLQISVITGTSAGGGCYSPALTDFIVMTRGSAMFLTGPKVVREALGEDVTAAALGGPAVHDVNGVCHFTASDDDDAVRIVHQLLDHVPHCAGKPAAEFLPAPAPEGDLGALVPAEERRVYDIRSVIEGLADGGAFLEVSARWARNLVVGFARIEGIAVGVVANQPRNLGGVLDTDASQKGARFVHTCDTFGVPLVVLVDTPGFMPGRRQETAGIIRHGAELLRAFAGAHVPRVTVVLRKAFGGAYITMNSKDLGAASTFAWPAATIGIMGPKAAVGIIHRRELAAAEQPQLVAARLEEAYASQHLSAARALELDLVDAVIEPAKTREYLVAALADAETGERRVRSHGG